MKLDLIKYPQYVKQVPETGKHILAQQTENQILVYQAFNPSIADYAVKHQHFGGSHYSYARMSWIKPNFLWMMYRCGWAEKEHQERVLGIWIDKSDFDKILEQAVYSSYQKEIFGERENWKQALAEKPVRLQWDPDHDIYGRKQERKAIQLGMKGNMLNAFGNTMVKEIIDITDFVKQQKQLIREKRLDELEVPKESIYKPINKSISRQIGLI
jgi:hypothetical protein